MITDFFFKIKQFPVEIMLCILFVLLPLFNFELIDRVNDDILLFWLLISCAFLYTARNTNGLNPVYYFLIGVVAIMLLPVFYYMEIETCEIFFLVGIVGVVSTCEKQNFETSYTRLCNDFFIVIVCNFFIYIELENVPFIGPHKSALLCVIFAMSVLFFCYLRTLQNRKSIFQKIMIGIQIAIICMLIYGQFKQWDYHSSMLFYRSRYLYIMCVSLFVVSIHLYLITKTFNKKIITVFTQIVNGLSVVGCFYITAFFLLHVGFRKIYLAYLLFGLGLAIMHCFVYVKQVVDLKKGLVLSAFALLVPVTSYCVACDAYAFYLKKQVSAFDEKYHLIDKTRFNRLVRRPPLAALKDPEFPNFMENKKKLTQMHSCILDPSLLCQYTVTPDSVIVVSPLERSAFSIEEWESFNGK